MTVTAVLFDLDDTVAADEAVVREAFLATCRLARERHTVAPEELAARVRERARELWRASPTHAYCRAIGISSWEGLCAGFDGDDPNLAALRAWRGEYRHAAWSAALRACGVDDPATTAALADAFPDERLRRCATFSESAAVLAALRSRCRIGLVTNGAPDLQRAKLACSGLGAFFDAVLISGEVGIGKPDPRIFHIALERLGAGPEGAIMVGDNPSRDVLGAQRAGIRSVWINRTGAVLPDGAPEPDMEIESLTELLNLPEVPGP